MSPSICHVPSEHDSTDNMIIPKVHTFGLPIVRRPFQADLGDSQ